MLISIYIFMDKFNITTLITKYHFYSFFLFTILSIFPCAPAHSNTSSLEKVSLQLNWKYQFEFAGFIAAKEKGFYDDVGLDVDILEYENGINVVDNVLLQEVQYGLYNSDILSKDKKILPSHLMATYFNQSPHVLAVSKEIKTPNDLVGKKIMLSQDELQNTNLGLMLTHFYVTNKNTSLIKPSFNINDFIKNNVDAISIYRTNELFHLNKLNAEYNIIDPADYNYASSAVNLFSSAREWRQHPERTKKFTEASNRGWEYALSHQQEIINIIYNKYSQEKSIEALTYEAIEVQKIMSLNSPIGAINNANLDKHLNQLKRAGLINDDQKLPIISEHSSSFTQQQLNYLHAKKEITMCVDPDWMPFEKISKGKHVGIAADVFSSFQKKLPIPIRLIETRNWTESLAKAKSRDCDILSLASSTDSRKEYMDFTSPYINLPVVLATKNNTIFIDNIAEVKDKKLGIVKGYSIADFLHKRIPDINIVEVKSVTDGLERVESGELFGFIDNLMTIAYAIQHDFTHSLKVSARLQEQINLAVSTRNDDTQLHAIFQILVNDINEIQMQSFYNNWVTVKEESSFDYRILWLLFSVAIFAILASIVSLKRLNSALMNQRQQAEQESERFKVLFEQSSNALLLIHDGIFIDCNEKAFRMLGYDSKEELIIKDPIKDISPKYQPDGELSLNKCVESTETCFRDGFCQFEWLHIKKDNSEILIDVTLTRLDYQDKRVLHVTWRDLTEQKEYESALIEAKDHARQANEAKSAFLANMSHELRTPMHGILSFAKIGLKKVTSATKEELTRYFSNIQISGERLMPLLDNLLDLSKIEAGKMSLNFEKGDLASLFDACQLEQKQRLLDLKLKLNIIQPKQKLITYFDKARISQVVTNLLSNAIKFSPENTTITASISQNTESEIVFSIEDEGVGIPEGELEDIFDAFIQSSKTNTGAGGTGLGLAISKEIIVAHNGKIWAENNNGNGVIVSFTLPITVKND